MTAADGDHPRLCGEKVSTTANATQQAGSPPPMRGKAFDANGDVTAAGITPAYAGKSWTCKCPVPESRDHPRLCGEKVRLICWRKIGAGSPPPMRGKADGAMIQRAKYRDHPRLCGEKESRLTELKKYPGSPPPMRGKVVSAFTTLVTVRITPAYAGKSRCRLQR